MKRKVVKCDTETSVWLYIDVKFLTRRPSCQAWQDASIEIWKVKDSSLQERSVLRIRNKKQCLFWLKSTLPERYKTWLRFAASSEYYLWDWTITAEYTKAPSCCYGWCMPRYPKEYKGTASTFDMASLGLLRSAGGQLQGKVLHRLQCSFMLRKRFESETYEVRVYWDRSGAKFNATHLKELKEKAYKEVHRFHGYKTVNAVGLFFEKKDEYLSLSNYHTVWHEYNSRVRLVSQYSQLVF